MDLGAEAAYVCQCRADAEFMLCMRYRGVR